MVNLLRIRKARSLHRLVQVGPITGAIEAMEQVLSLVEKARSFHPHKTLVTDVGKADIRKHRTAKHWMQCADVVERRGTLRKCLKAKHSTHSLEVPQASTSSAGAGAGEALYFDDQGQPVFAHMVSVLHLNKHLIKSKPARHAPRKVPIHLQEAFHEEIRNMEALGILEETKDVTEWVNSFVIVEKKLPIDSSNSHSPGHSEQETKDLFGSQRPK